MIARRFATVLGAFLLIEGIWGLFSPVVFGVLTTNLLHAVIHIALGVTGLLAARGAAAGKYLMFVGALLLVVGILRFVPGASDLVVSLLNVNVAVAWVNIIVGAAALIVSMTDKNPGTAQEVD
ncbi:MAG: DUF4383 domain-containing protein [Gemmatimonadaceae bacterium]